MYGSSNGLAPAQAADLLAQRVLALPPIFDGGTGLAFLLNPPAKNKWQFFFNREIIPRLEVRGFVGEASGLKRKSAVRLVGPESAHVFHGSGMYGRPVDLYLSLKLSQLRRRKVQAVTSNLDRAAGIGFRAIFNEVWTQARPDDSAPRWLSFWASRVQSFIATYDSLLAASSRADEIRAAFTQVGLDHNAWFAR